MPQLSSDFKDTLIQKAGRGAGPLLQGPHVPITLDATVPGLRPLAG